MFATKSHDSQDETSFSIDELSIQLGIFHPQQCPLFHFSFVKSKKPDLHFIC